MKNVYICLFLILFFAPKIEAQETTPNTTLQFSDKVCSLGGGYQKRINGLMREAIREKATPGANVFFAKNGAMLFFKSYGHHTYKKDRDYKRGDVFDLASITKVAATTLATMKLYEEGTLNLNKTVGGYLPYYAGSNKATIRVKDLLLHEAGLKPFIPFYKKITPNDLSDSFSQEYSVALTDSLFLKTDFYDRVMHPAIKNSPLSDKKKYVYSDLSMYLLQEIIVQISGMPLDTFVEEHFYKPLQLKKIGFQARKKFVLDDIVPTEQDTLFRNTLIRGYVHDPGAVLVNGVAGHAGLFADVKSLAIIFQMLLNGGVYDGKRYLKKETIDYFTRRHSTTGSRRGLGFDMSNTSGTYPTKNVSTWLFGHYGYTGTCVWADPKENFIYIFLSNRVHPNDSKKLLNMNTRTNILDIFTEWVSDHKVEE